MAVTYKKDGRNIYVIPLYARFWVWLVAFTFVALILSVLWYYLRYFWLLLIMVGLWSLVAILAIWRAYSLVRQVIKAKSIVVYFTQRNAAKSITKSLLATMTVNRLQDTPFISVPKVTV